MDESQSGTLNCCDTATDASSVTMVLLAMCLHMARLVHRRGWSLLGDILPSTVPGVDTCYWEA